MKLVPTLFAFLLVCACAKANDTSEEESCHEALERNSKDLTVAAITIWNLTNALFMAEKKLTRAQEDINLIVHGSRILYDNATGEYEATMCEWHSSQILCPDGKSIEITYADYGRHDHTTCANTEIYSTTCSSNKTMSYVTSTCSGRTSCRLSANFRLIGEDPCLYTAKYLRVTFKCST